MKNILPLLLMLCLSTTVRAYDEQQFKASYVSYGEEYLGKSWAVLPVTEFAGFKKNGNRVIYEGLCFERRRQLAALVMAEIQERKGRFMPDIINGLELMLEEPWWGIPAHYNKPIPLHENQTVDLFNAETASLIAWTGKELRKELDCFSPDLYKKIEREINHRILKPALGTKYWWKTASMNWNPWICSNWLTCVMLYERDAEKRQQAVTEIEGCMKAFIDAYPEDGGCDEGTGYWDRAAASLFECLYQLKQIQEQGQVKVTMLTYKPEKVHRMGQYIYNMYIANGYSVNFADAHDNKSVAQLNVLYPFAIYLNDKDMRSFAAWIAKDKDFFANPAALYDKSGNFPTLGRELMLHKHLQQLADETPQEPKTEAWLADLQIKTMRSPSITNHTSKIKNHTSLFVAFKGGNNGESHNHNDVGSFILYADGEPLLMDAGVGEYTSKTFSNDRYSIWTMQSAYHNLPQINGFDQKDGKEYHATVIKQGSRSMTLDIAPAYPKEAAVKQWLRTVSMKGKEVTLNEKYELTECKAPTKLMFMTVTKPGTIGTSETSETSGTLHLGNHTLHYPASMLDVEVEDLASFIDPVIERLWGKNLYRIVFTVKDMKPKGEITIRIK